MGVSEEQAQAADDARAAQERDEQEQSERAAEEQRQRLEDLKDWYGVDTDEELEDAEDANSYDPS